VSKGIKGVSKGIKGSRLISLTCGLAADRFGFNP
jgi:hypothetical protein